MPAAAAFAVDMAKDAKAGHEHAHTPKAPAELERLKGLAGVWEGTSAMMKDQKATITYTVSADGSAGWTRIN